MGNVRKDDGALIGAAVQSAATQGVTSEGPAASTSNGATWPYVADKFRHRVNPGAATTSRAQVVVTGYAKVAPGLDAIKSDLAAGSPVVIGISTYQNVPMEERDWPRPPSTTGALPTITLPSGKDTGGHAILAVGYDDARQSLIILNPGARSGEKMATPISPTPTPRIRSGPIPATTSRSTARPRSLRGHHRQPNDLTRRGRMDRMPGLVDIDMPCRSSGTAAIVIFRTIGPGRPSLRCSFSNNAEAAT